MNDLFSTALEALSSCSAAAQNARHDGTVSTLCVVCCSWVVGGPLAQSTGSMCKRKVVSSVRGKSAPRVTACFLDVEGSMVNLNRIS